MILISFFSHHSFPIRFLYDLGCGQMFFPKKILE